MREDTIFAVVTALAVSVAGLCWFLYMDRKQQRKDMTLEPSELWRRCYETDRSRKYDQ